MSRFLDLLHKGYTVGTRRVKDQGLALTFLWAYARGLPAVTGIPILKYSRVTDQLFVGPQFRANGLRYLQRAGINAVVNLRKEVDDLDRGLVPDKYCYLPTVDDQAPSLEHLDRGVDFIHEVITEGGKVYIHCGAGVGRAPTMAAAYLIATGYSLDQALAAIREVRPFIYIMPPQMEQLKVYSTRNRPPFSTIGAVNQAG